METDRESGFLIIPSSTKTTDRYMMLKRKLNKFADYVKEHTLLYERNNIIMTARLSSGIFMSGCFKENQLYLAIYDFRERTMYRDYPEEKLSTLFANVKIENLGYDFEDAVISATRGIIFCHPEISDSWNRWFQQKDSITKLETTAMELRQIAMENFNNEDFCLPIAEHLNTDKKTLHVLAQNPYISVKIAVAQNPNTGISTLRMLLNDPKVAGYAELHPRIAHEIKNNLLLKETLKV